MLNLDVIQRLPKADLHCHLDGFLRAQTVLDLAKEQGLTLPTTNLEELKSLMVAPADCPDLPTYLSRFDLPLKVMQEPYALTRIVFEACEDAVKDGIIYLELRFAPVLHTKNGHSYSQILEAAIQGCMMAEEKLDITVRIICCAMRHMDPTLSAEIAEVCWRYRHRYVVGFDLAGPEQGFPPHKHLKAFHTIRQQSLSLTICAGEAYGAPSVALAMQCSAHRIGHGTRVVEDERVLNEVIDRRIPLEMCVTSNFITKAIQKVDDHPIKKLFDLGVRTVPCSDNPTVSGVTLSGEYHLLVEKFGFTVADVLQLLDFGFRSAFVEEGIRRRLRVEAFVRSVKILQESKVDISGLDPFYYERFGMTIPPRFVPPVRNPPLTLELIKELPKCDLDCRLVGSVPPRLLFQFYGELPEESRTALPVFGDCEDLLKWLLDPVDSIGFNRAKELAIRLLQTEPNLRAAVRGILGEAAADRVSYLELTVFPTYHTREGLTAKGVVDIILDEIGLFKDENLRVSLVLNANIARVSPLEMHQIAELCVEYQGKGVVGFATTTAEIAPAEMKYFEETFEFLRAHFVPVTIFAGETKAESVSCALFRGHARRISGAFQLTESAALLHDVTAHGVAVLCALSRRMGIAVSGWKKSPVRFFVDFGVRVAFCSIHHTLQNMTRSEQLFAMAEQSGFDAFTLLEVLYTTFGAALLPYKETVQYRRMLWEKSTAIVKAHGFSSTMNYAYFAPQ
jgi:adenosine deaminase